MTYDRSAIMKSAWKNTRDLMERLSYAAHQLRSVFADELRRAWVDAKNAAILAARTIDSLRAEFQHLENKTTLGWEGLQRITLLQSVIAKKKRDAELADFAAKRDLIASTAEDTCSVTFIKKDGTLRQMRVKPSELGKRIKGDQATKAGRKAAQTRRERHPNLFPVWDADKDAVRSINLATVTRIATNGVVHTFA